MILDFGLHSAVHAARPDIRCIIYIDNLSVVAISATKIGLLPLTHDACQLGDIAIHTFSGSINEPEEKEKLIRNFGPNSKVLLLRNHGALCCGESVEEAFYTAFNVVQACESQLKLLPLGIENLVLISEETKKIIFNESTKPPFLVGNASDNKDKMQQVRFFSNIIL